MMKPAPLLENDAGHAGTYIPHRLNTQGLSVSINPLQSKIEARMVTGTAIPGVDIAAGHHVKGLLWELSQPEPSANAGAVTAG